LFYLNILIVPLLGWIVPFLPQYAYCATLAVNSGFSTSICLLRDYWGE
ncbi:MAG: hypothetical protein ACI892_002079, partial [Marinobacter maritimus]